MDMGPWLHKTLGHVGPKTMCKVAQRWHIPLMFAEAKQAVQACAQCAYFSLHHHQVSMQKGQLPCPPEPLQVWQVDYIGPLPRNQGCKYALTAVDLPTGLGFAHPMAHPTQQTTKRAIGI